MKRKLILITGGSASGKTHLAQELKKLFKNNVTLLSQDSFYKDKSDTTMNYDIPSAFDFETQQKVLQDLIDGKEANVPIYDFKTNGISGYNKVEAKQYIILEGLFSFHDKKTEELADFKIFVDTPADTRMSRRIIRDVNERGREVKEVVNRWLKDVQPSYNQFISTYKKEADIIIPYHKIKPRALKSAIVTIINLDKDLEEILTNI